MLIQIIYYQINYILNLLKWFGLKRNHSAVNKSNEHLGFQGWDVSPAYICLPRLRTATESIINVPLAL